ncbi:hypothetical protein F3Y22_tig00116968pilonHSYRG00070 [Hibiscus syriacus]|uniref:RNase H type-1 domain-containing protein n=1 Tax=Hibiscus syriacus TaxID=106335 RepID=A0A6A2XR76_HIBSY|nr:hypothetical protein F3Y22_tig00116968pilonHSYRG00070 [Hibiscus syriacus]
MAEALAYEYAIRLSKELGFHKIVLEGDCFEVIAKLQRPLLDRSSISTILLNIESMKDDFEELTFLHVPRICNTLAHPLAVINFFSSLLIEAIFTPPILFKVDLLLYLIFFDALHPS